MNQMLWMSQKMLRLGCSVLIFQSQAGRIVAIGARTCSSILSFFKYVFRHSQGFIYYSKMTFAF